MSFYQNINLASITTSSSPTITFSGNVGLWTTSIFLSFISLVFAAIASFYSSKASKDTKHLIQTQWINDQANKIFFTNLKEIDVLTTNVLTNLRKVKGLTFNEYAGLTTNCRIHPVSQESFELLKPTKFFELTNKFIEEKNYLDKLFFEIIDVEDLKSFKEIPDDIISKLVKYHLEVQNKIKEIIKKYTIITTT